MNTTSCASSDTGSPEIKIEAECSEKDTLAENPILMIYQNRMINMNHFANEGNNITQILWKPLTW